MGIRDNHQFSKGSVSTLYGLNGPNKTFWWSGTTYGPSTDTCRNTPITTLPLPNGVFYHPTTYGGHRYIMSTHPYKYRINGGYWDPFPEWQMEGESTTGMWPIPFNTYGCLYGDRPYVPDVPYWLVQEAKAKLWDQMKSRDFDLVVFLAELPQAINTIADLAVSGASLIKKFQSTELYVRWQNYRKPGWKNPNKGSFWDIEKELARLWLTYKYGLETIMHDIHGAATRASKAISPDPFAITETRMLDPTYVGFGTPWPSYLPVWIDRSTFKRGVNVRVAWRVTNPALYALDSFGIINPAVVAWELTTLSFVIDWFTGIGNFLQSMSNPIGVSFVYGYETKWLKNNYDITYCGHSTPKGSLPRVTGKLHAMHRSVYADFPVPLPYLRMPVSVTKAVTAIALLGRR